MSSNCDADFATFVRSALGHQVYREDGAPQDTREPYATYERLDTIPVNVMNASTKLSQGIYRVTLYSTNPVAISTMEDAVWGALAMYKGTMGSTKVQRIFVESISTRILPPTDGGQPRVHTREFDVSVWFERDAIQR
jgi:hypothetical protein